MRREYQKQCVVGIFILYAPRQRRQINTFVRGIKYDFDFSITVIRDNGTASLGANQELMTFEVRVLSPHFPVRDAVNHEIALWSERNLFLKFADGKHASQVRNNGEIYNPHAFDQKLFIILASDLLEDWRRLWTLSVDVADNLSRIPLDNRSLRHGAGHNSAWAYSGSGCDSQVRADHRSGAKKHVIADQNVVSRIR